MTIAKISNLGMKVQESEKETIYTQEKSESEIIKDGNILNIGTEMPSGIVFFLLIKMRKKLSK